MIEANPAGFREELRKARAQAASLSLPEPTREERMEAAMTRARQQREQMDRFMDSAYRFEVHRDDERMEEMERYSDPFYRNQRRDMRRRAMVNG